MKKIFLLPLAFFVFAPIYSASLDELVGTDRAAELRAAARLASPMEPVTEVQQKIFSPRLLPRHRELSRLVNESQNSFAPNLLVETLSLYSKPHAAEWKETEQISLLNHLASLSTLAGIQYYSERRKTMRTFYESSCVIDNPAEKNPLPDPVFTALPDSFELYTRQRDLTFGDNVYRLNYYAGKDYVAFVQENLTTMNSGIIPALGKNNLRSFMAIIDSGDSLLIYAAAMAKSPAVPGMGERIGLSFVNRAKALLTWLNGRLDGLFLK